MATPKTNSFTSWNLTEAEFIAGSVLSVTQLQVIQNLLSDVAENKLSLSFDPANPQDYGVQVAFLDGQIAAFKHILATHEASQDRNLQLKLESGD